MLTESKSSQLDETAGSKPAQEAIEISIKRHPFLKDMSPHQHRLLADCAMYSHFDAGELIFREGDPADRFYLIQKGSVALEAFAGGRGFVPIQNVDSGSVLGWSWLFPPYFWHFTARALEPTDVILFRGRSLREECESDHDLGWELMKRICSVIGERLQATRRHLYETGRGPVEMPRSRKTVEPASAGKPADGLQFP